jgi:hypothetical protein
MIRECSKCKESKDVSLFYRRTPYRPTEDTYDYYCKACRNASAKKTFKANKTQHLKTGKVAGICCVMEPHCIAFSSLLEMHCRLCLLKNLANDLVYEI